MTIKTKKEDIAEKLIDSEIQKTGEQIIESLPEYPEIHSTPEELEKEFQELMRKRKENETATGTTVSFIEEERARKKRIPSTLTKAAVIFLVVGACFFGFSMRSEATRMWWLNSVAKIVGEDRREAVDNDDNRVVSSTSEDDARQVILEEIGVPMPVMAYRPIELEYDGYRIDSEWRRGELYYFYGEYLVRVLGYVADFDVSYYNIHDGEVVSEKELETNYGIVRIMEVIAENDEDMNIIAEWSYKNNSYCLTGKMPVEDAEKIVENIFY